MRRLLARLFVLFACVVACLPARAGEQLSKRFVERTLAQYYESLVRRSLSDMIPESDFKPFISVDIEDSPEFKQFQDEQAADALPGTITHTTDYSSPDFLARLEELPQKRQILLILSENVKKDLIPLLQETLTGKLRLNLAAQTDVLAIKGGPTNTPSRMPASSNDGSKQKPHWPDMTTLIGLLLVGSALLGLAWLMLRKKHGAEDAKDEARPFPKFGEDSPEGELANEKTVADEALAEKNYNFPNKISDMQELRSEIESLARSYPGLASRALKRAADDDRNLNRVAAMIELLGHQRTLDLFREVPQSVWKRVGQHMSEYPLNSNTPMELEEIAVLFRTLLAHIIENKGYDSDMGIFASLKGHSPVELVQVLLEEPPRNVAIFLAGVSESTLFDILPRLGADKRAEVLYQMSIVGKVDSNEISTVETRLRQKLSGNSKSPKVDLQNDSRIFASMALMPPHEEEELFEAMRRSDPSVEKRARRHRLYTIHLAYIRRDILQEELRAAGVEELAKVLRGVEQGIGQLLMSLLPERKAAVVTDTLVQLERAPMGPEYAAARRALLDAIYEKHIGTNKDFADGVFEDGGDTIGRAAA